MKSTEITDFVDNLKYPIFQVYFVKRTDKSIRALNCRKGVKQFLKGGEKKFKDSDKGLVTVCDMMIAAKNKRDNTNVSPYRSFGVDQVIAIKAGGKTHLVDDFDVSLVFPQFMSDYKAIISPPEIHYHIQSSPVESPIEELINERRN